MLSYMRRRIYKGVEIPEHVSRVDSGAAAPKGWHGWQVRWRDHNKWFSDCNHKDDLAALEAAAQYALQNFPGKVSQCRPDRGIVLKWVKKSSGDLTYQVVEVSKPWGGAATRLYCGTANTTSFSRVKARVRQARALRRRWISLHNSRHGLLHRADVQS